jgi:hypothetical protein
MRPNCGVARGFRDESVRRGDDLDSSPQTANPPRVSHGVVVNIP